MPQSNKSKWFAKSRINVDGDLLIESTKGITISDDTRFTGATNLSVSFSIEAKTLVGDCITKGVTILTIAQLGLIVDQKTNIVINANGDWWKNGVKQSTTLSKDWTVAGDIVVGQTNNPEFTMSNLIFIDLNLTQQQVNYPNVNGGIIPESAHEFCIAHSPLQTAYDDGVDNVTPDILEQYNYAKVTALTANHGVLANYTDDELGLGADFDNQTAVKDFYDKVDFQDVQFEQPVEPVFQDNIEVVSGFEPRVKAITFDGVDQYLRVPNFNPTKELGYSWVIGFSLDSNRNFDSSFHDVLFSKRSAGNYPSFALFGLNGDKRMSYDNRITVGDNRLNTFDLDPIRLNDINTLAFNQQDFPGTNTAYLNGNVVYERNNVSNQNMIGIDTITGDMHIGHDPQLTARYYEGFIYYLMILKGNLTRKEILELTNNTLLKNPSIALQNKYSLELFVDFNNPWDDAGTLKFPDLSPNAHDIIAENYTDLATLQSNLVNINSLR